MVSRAALSSAVGLPPNVGISAFSDTGPAPDPEGVVVDMGGIVVTPENITENDDGGVTIDTTPEDVKPQPTVFSDNLAEYMDEAVLDRLAEQGLEGLRVDIESRKPWMDNLTEGMKYLGWTFEDRDFPFPGASGIYDTIMSEAVLRNQAQTCAELLPASGPAKTQIIGNATEQAEQKAERIRSWMNYYFLEGAPEWLEQKEQLFLWRAIAGSVFSKVYQDPILNRPVSPFLTPDKVVVSYYCDSEMETCPRVSQLIDSTYKELRQNQISGFYRDIPLLNPDLTTQGDLSQKVDSIVGLTRPDNAGDDVDTMKNYEIVEQHVDLDLEGYEDKDENDELTGIPLPYILTIEKSSKKVLALRRNWRDGDDAKQKISYFIHWRMLPGLGFYGNGYAVLLGNPAKGATGLQRQLTDAATLEAFPGGLRVKGMRFDSNNVMVGPCSFEEIETGGLPIQQAIMTMPYKGPSEVSLALWTKTRENAQSLASVSDLQVGDGRQDAPVGTTLALLEAANRMMSATIKSAHRSLRKEFKLFAALFGQYLPDEPYPFPVPGGEQAIMRADFSDEIDVIPVSDPNITSYAQRVTRAEAMLRFALQAPEIHDKRAAFKNMYVEMGVDERKIEAILPPPDKAVPTDPLTENQMALTGKPVAVGPWQDHQAHIKAHQVLAEQVPNLAAHIAEHLAAAMRVNVEKLLGITLPPAGTKLPPEVENRLAVLVAQALEQLNSPQGPEPSPGQIAMAEIQVEAQKVQVELQAIQARATTEAFKAQKKFITDEKDRQERIANATAERQTKVQLEFIRAQTKRAESAANRAQRAQSKPTLN